MTKKDIDADALAEFEDSSVTAQLRHTDNGDLSIRYLEIRSANAEKPTIIFIHNPPGGSDNYYDYLKNPLLIDSFNLIITDRLGYGGSMSGVAEPSINKYTSEITLSNTGRFSHRQQNNYIGGSFIWWSSNC